MQTRDEEGQMGVLDVLIVCAENIKLLWLGPLLVGGLVFLLAFALPQSFTSQAILISAPVHTPTIMASPLVLDPVISALNWSDGTNMESARARLSSQIKALAGKDGLLRLEVTANRPEEAQKIANLIITAYLRSTVPGALERADLEQRLAYAKSALQSVRQLLERTTSGAVHGLNKPLIAGELGTNMVALGELQARYLTEVLSIPRTLQGVSRDTVIQTPTLPMQASAPNKMLIASWAALLSGLALLFALLCHKSWLHTQQDPVIAEKQARLQAALRFKSPLR